MSGVPPFQLDVLFELHCFVFEITDLLTGGCLFRSGHLALLVGIEVRAVRIGAVVGIAFVVVIVVVTVVVCVGIAPSPALLAVLAAVPALLAVLAAVPVFALTAVVFALVLPILGSFGAFSIFAKRSASFCSG